jgi:hypothetical protein
MKALFDFAGRLSVKEPAVHGRLAVYPVFGDGSPALSYLTLGEALAAGGFKVGELGGGSVPELMVSNHTGHLVLLLDGEELIGAKQNRILNTSILVEAGSEIRIPVSCVEHGRWDRGAAAMRAGEVAYPELRMAKARQVHDSLRRTGLHRSDQGALWQEIAEHSAELRAEAPTGRMEAMYEAEREPLAEALRHLPCCPGACGVVAVIGGRIACADVFDSPSTLEKLWDRLLTSYALDARTAPGPSTPAALPIDAVLRFLSVPPESLLEVFPTPGIGQNLRFRTADRAGSALVFQDAVVHLEVFPANGGSQQASRPTRIVRPSDRGPRV